MHFSTLSVILLATAASAQPRGRNARRQYGYGENDNGYGGGETAAVSSVNSPVETPVHTPEVPHEEPVPTPDAPSYEEPVHTADIPHHEPSHTAEVPVETPVEHETPKGYEPYEPAHPSSVFSPELPSSVFSPELPSSVFSPELPSSSIEVEVPYETPAVHYGQSSSFHPELPTHPAHESEVPHPTGASSAVVPTSKPGGDVYTEVVPSTLTYTLGYGSSATVVVTTVQHTLTRTLTKTVFATRPASTNSPDRPYGPHGGNPHGPGGDVPHAPPAAGPTTTVRHTNTVTQLVTVYPSKVHDQGLPTPKPHHDDDVCVPSTVTLTQQHTVYVTADSAPTPSKHADTPKGGNPGKPSNPEKPQHSNSLVYPNPSGSGSPFPPYPTAGYPGYGGEYPHGVPVKPTGHVSDSLALPTASASSSFLAVPTPSPAPSASSVSAQLPSFTLIQGVPSVTPSAGGYGYEPEVPAQPWSSVVSPQPSTPVADLPVPTPTKEVEQPGYGYGGDYAYGN